MFKEMLLEIEKLNAKLDAMQAKMDAWDEDSEYTLASDTESDDSELSQQSAPATCGIDSFLGKRRCSWA